MVQIDSIDDGSIPTLEQWCNDILHGRRASLTAPMRVTGLRDKHLGPRSEYAKIEVVVEPSDEWQLDIELPEELAAALREKGYVRQIAFGLLDVLSVGMLGWPLLDLRVRIVSAILDPVESSMMAFRMAARHAAEQIIASARTGGLWKPTRLGA